LAVGGMVWLSNAVTEVLVFVGRGDGLGDDRSRAVWMDERPPSRMSLRSLRCLMVASRLLRRSVWDFMNGIMAAIVQAVTCSWRVPRVVM
jgi:hypothetical protein